MRLSKETPETMGRANKLSVLQLIRHRGPISRAGVAKALGLSRSTVSSIVDQLISDGRVSEGDRGQSTALGGKRPIFLYYVQDAKFALGIDVGTTKTLTILTDLSGRVIARKQFSSSWQGDPSLEHVVAEVEAFLQTTGVDVEKIVGTGVGIPGNVDNSRGIIVESPGLNVSNYAVRELLETRLPSPVIIDNDVNMAVIGERWKGIAKDCRNAVFIAVGTGIGAGLILNGRVYRGSSGNAGELGHLHLDPFGKAPKLSLADFGPLERLASGRGIESQVESLAREFPDSMLDVAAVKAEDVFVAAARGDELAKHVLERAFAYLSFSIANLVTLLNPDVVIVGGGVSRAGDVFIQNIRRQVKRLSPMDCQIVLASLGEDAAAFGSAATALMRAGEIALGT